VNGSECLCSSFASFHSRPFAVVVVIASQVRLRKAPHCYREKVGTNFYCVKIVLTVFSGLLPQLTSEGKEKTNNEQITNWKIHERVSLARSQ